MLKYFLLIVHLTYALGLIKPEPNKGIFYEKLGSVQLFHNYLDIIYAVNLTEFSAVFDNAVETLQKTKEICERIDVLYCRAEHQSNTSCPKAMGTYNCHQLLELITTDLKNINITLDTFLSQFHTEKHGRNKRGAVDAGGYFFKLVFGTLLESDIEFYKKQFEALKSNGEHMDAAVKGLKASYIQNKIWYRESLQTIKDALEKNMTETIENINKFINRTMEQDEILNLSNHMNYMVNSLSTTVTQLKSNIQKLFTSEGLAKYNILHSTLLTPDRFLELLKNAKIKNGENFPVDISKENIPIFLRILSLNVVSDGCSMLFHIKLPLVTNETYQLFKVHSLPIIRGSNEVARLVLKGKYYLFSGNKWASLDSLSVCKELSSASNQICKLNHVTSDAETSEICEVALRRNDSSKCKLLLLGKKTNIFIPEYLGNNKWLIISNSQRKYTDSCESEENILTSGTYSLILDPGCIFVINNKTFTATKTITKYLNHEFPNVEILNKTYFNQYLKNNQKEVHLGNVTLVNNWDEWENYVDNTKNDTAVWNDLNNHEQEHLIWRAMIATSVGSVLLIALLITVGHIFYKRRQGTRNYSSNKVAYSNKSNLKSFLENEKRLSSQ